MLLKEHEAYYNPDLIFKAKENEISRIQVSKQTDPNGGESMEAWVPIYDGDTRQEIYDRMQFVCGLLHDRMEDYNKAWLRFNEEAKAKQEAEEAKRKEKTAEKIAQKKIKKLEKQGKIKVLSDEKEVLQ
jgi:hypothetical protein